MDQTGLTMDYTQITPAEQNEMLTTIGVNTIDDLFASIPDDCRLGRDLELPPAAAELDLQRELTALAEENNSAATHACFMGAGAYDHFIPALIDQMILRGEFLTAYTPYQAEASQGSLQAFFEFQTLIARLTHLDIANASLYEGATAVAEAALMALNATGKRRVLMASTVHPDYRRVVHTMLGDLPIEIIEINHDQQTGCVAPAAIQDQIDNDTACVIVQSPNFFGLIEDWSGCFEAAHQGPGTLAIGVFNPIACGLLKSPGECGADIAVGEGQSLGTPLQFGGPYLGLFAAKKELTRKMPGRLVGRTVDTDGRPSYCLVLQTREQHIRRDKATSNICTNQGLLALRAAMFMNALGPKGLHEMAEQSYHKAHYAANAIAALNGFALKHPTTAFFHEFVITAPTSAARIVEDASDYGLMLGPALASFQASQAGNENDLLICVTEKRTRDEIDALVEFLSNYA